MNDVRQSDLIVNKEENKIRKVSDNVEKKLQVPNGYYPIRLATKGKLDLPDIVHFRNYNLDEILELASINDEEERIFSLIKCLNNMMFEDINLEVAHEKELVEIMMNVYFIFNSKSIGPYNYYIDDTIEDLEEKNKKENIREITLNNNHFNVIPIADNFKEPIKITYKNKVFKFRLPRIKNSLIAREYVLEKYQDEKNKFVELEYILKVNSNKNLIKKLPYNENEKKEYDEYIKNKTKDFLKVNFAVSLYGDDKSVFTLEEAIDKIDKQEVDLGFWSKYYDIIDKKVNFGINNEITFEDPVSMKILSRGFLLQTFDFIPNMELQGNTDYTFQFGD